MRINLETIGEGKYAKRIVIGTLTETQLAAINIQKVREDLPTIVGEILFIGRHIYESRVERDGYTIEDVLDQISSGMDPSSTVVHQGHMTGLKNLAARQDRYGNSVNDVVIFECSRFHPNPELYGVIPEGDRTKPAKIGKGHLGSGGPTS